MKGLRKDREMTPAKALREWIKREKNREGTLSLPLYMGASCMAFGVFVSTGEWFENLFGPYYFFTPSLPMDVVFGASYAAYIGLLLMSFFDFWRGFKMRRRLGIKVDPLRRLIVFAVVLLGTYGGITYLYEDLIETRFANGAAHIAIGIIVPMAFVLYSILSGLLEVKGVIEAAVQRGILAVRNGQLEAVEDESERVR